MPLPLILASASPRRQEALAALGVPFEIVPSRAEEALTTLEDPADPKPIAAAKANDIAAYYPDAVVLSGDTIVTIDALALGKPGSPAAAADMLRRLRGRAHVVRTGLAVRSDNFTLSEVAAPLQMRDYSDEEIERYVASGEPMDCAGAYDVHRAGGALVERVEGCFSAVVGLPLLETAHLLTQAAVTIPHDPVLVCSRLYGRRCLAADPATAHWCRASS